jgi:tetratricopeptide (TPR) repeat protein
MRACIVLLLLLYATRSFAEFDIQQLRQLIDGGNSTQAYHYAQSGKARDEGDADFDYYYGIAAIDTGHASEGVFALERVLTDNPDDNAARLELARGYFILEEYARSRQEFETALAASPPDNVSTKIVAYLDAIRLRESRYNTVATSYIELGLGSDSNVNAGPISADAFLQYQNFSFLGTSAVGSNSLETSDSFYDLTANYGIQHPVAAGFQLLGAATANLRNHNTASNFDNTTLTLRGGIQASTGTNTYTSSLLLQSFDLDGRDYRDLTGLNLLWKNQFSQNTILNTGLNFTVADYANQSYLNADIIDLSFGMSHRLDVTLDPVLYFSVFVAQDSARETTTTGAAKTDRDYVGLRSGSLLSTSSQSALNLALTYQQSEYGAPDNTLVVPIVRADDYLQLSLDYTWLIDRDWRLNTLLSHTTNSSNLDTSDYDRTVLLVSVRYDIQ